MMKHSRGDKMYLQVVELLHNDDEMLVDELIEVMTEDELCDFMGRLLTKFGVDVEE